jgi:hypothetical protein
VSECQKWLSRIVASLLASAERLSWIHLFVFGEPSCGFRRSNWKGEGRLRRLILGHSGFQKGLDSRFAAFSLELQLLSFSGHTIKKGERSP